MIQWDKPRQAGLECECQFVVPKGSHKVFRSSEGFFPPSLIASEFVLSSHCHIKYIVVNKQRGEKKKKTKKKCFVMQLLSKSLVKEAFNCCSWRVRNVQKGSLLRLAMCLDSPPSLLLRTARGVIRGGLSMNLYIHRVSSTTANTPALNDLASSYRGLSFKPHFAMTKMLKHWPRGCESAEHLKT